MEDRIINAMEENKSYSEEDLMNILNLDNFDETSALCKTLQKLTKKKKIFITGKNRYKLIKGVKDKFKTKKCSNTVEGKLSIVATKGIGFVLLSGGKDLFINSDNLNGARDGDIVLAECIREFGPDSDKNPVGKVLKVLDRKPIIGRYVFNGKKAYVQVTSEKEQFLVEVNPKKSNGAVTGCIVAVNLDRKLKNNNYQGTVTKLIGHENEAGFDEKLEMAKAGIVNWEFPEEVIEQVLKIENEVQREDLKDRFDLTNELIVTIDGKDTKDIDDAISCKRLPDGNYLLGVHIADVSHYVKEDTPLSDEALQRGNSVYLGNKVTPMLPVQLSNGICSLNEGVIRLALSCEMVINNEGYFVGKPRVFKSYIKSTKQMNYESFNDVIDGKEVEGYSEYKDFIYLMNEVALKLRDRRMKEGYNDFDIEEPYLVFDENDEVIGITSRERGAGEKAIENFMIAANEAVAKKMKTYDMPAIYRVHDIPEEKKVKDLLQQLSILGVKFNSEHENFKHGSSMQKLLITISELEEKGKAQALRSLALRAMQKAIYSTNSKIGHYSLSLKDYLHFTAPIRRYSDLTVHRGIKYLIKEGFIKDVPYYEKQFDVKTKEVVKVPESEDITKLSNKLSMNAKAVSITERKAIECERSYMKLKSAEYVEGIIHNLNILVEEGKITEKMKLDRLKSPGVITGLTPKGLFVQLPNYIEGMVNMKNFKDGNNYIYNEQTLSFMPKKGDKSLTLGDEVYVMIVDASKENKAIDFTLITKDECKKVEEEFLDISIK